MKIKKKSPRTRTKVKYSVKELKSFLKTYLEEKRTRNEAYENKTIRPWFYVIFKSYRANIRKVD